ncbi:hypothetical protein O181_041871 [Austropuccinia psidii MF-1]|uniref:Reverse transcriptase Ty1/copia-type domain-containing protein n=1 Tax=Austropuccinia psidii MF-1 TaxID=1389203 RepID=A0A9Q3DDT6_9BASI|nr:hypothetical protein [Austropuccinia psidii MF-1]
MKKVPVVASKDISSSIDTSNIFHSKRDRVRDTTMEETSPRPNSQAVAHENSLDWEEIDKKIPSIEENDVWVPVETSSNDNILGSTWVFEEKEDKGRNIVKYKAHLCVHGFSQREVVDYN